jgi:thymidine phosphorylase
MISGRGLGHTGGTLDKLEAIPGYRTDLAEERLKNILQEVGCFISGQTSELAPADRILYALRNETQTVECIPLIVGSILSKKLAEGLDRLVLDVKVGSGAFMQTMESAQALAQALVTTGKGAGIQTSALLTDMEQPLGEACGNALEVEEAIDCLQGGGPADLSALTVALAGHPEAARVLASGAAYERFCRMVAAQGGVLSKLKHDTHGPVQKLVLEAPEAGFIQKCDARTIGVAVFRLGAGRLKAEDPVHSGVGARIHCKVGDMVAQGQPLITLYHAEQNAELAFALVKQAVAIVERPCSPRSLVLGRFE